MLIEKYEFTQKDSKGFSRNRTLFFASDEVAENWLMENCSENIHKENTYADGSGNPCMVAYEPGHFPDDDNPKWVGILEWKEQIKVIE